MPLKDAINALKRKDFAEARKLIAREDAATYGIQHYLILGLAEMSLQEWQAALEAFTAATKRFPNHAPFWFNRGIVEENLKLIDAAIASHERCLALAPDQAEACGNLSNLYRNKRRYADAENMARRAMEKGADKGEALNCLGLALAKQGKFDEARDAFLQAHEAAPDNPAFLSNHANLEIEVFHFDQAWKLFTAARAIEDRPVFRYDEGLARLLSGDFKLGFKLLESRLLMPNALRLIPSYPRWKGERLKGKKLLIIAEQGFGDVLQFCRYQKFLPDVDLVWAVPKNLVRLLSGSLRGDVVDEKSLLPRCDAYVPILSLAHETKDVFLPAMEPYLRAPMAPALPAGTHKLKIGLVWAGSRTHARDNERSIPLRLLEPILNSVNADFYAPFVGDGLEEIGKYPVTRLDDLISDFADTAALLKQMDCLVTVDTAVAHLAGALGLKTYLLLPRCPDWRWGILGKTTPLYPSMTLVRQKTYGDWTGVIEKLLPILKINLARWD
ncbi:MAG: tetratricopeptide repeat protein [Bdellovibrionales bacterium]